MPYYQAFNCIHINSIIHTYTLLCSVDVTSRTHPTWHYKQRRSSYVNSKGPCTYRQTSIKWTGRTCSVKKKIVSNSPMVVRGWKVSGNDRIYEPLASWSQVFEKFIQLERKFNMFFIDIFIQSRLVFFFLGGFWWGFQLPELYSVIFFYCRSL